MRIGTGFLADTLEVVITVDFREGPKVVGQCFVAVLSVDDPGRETGDWNARQRMRLVAKTLLVDPQGRSSGSARVEEWYLLILGDEVPERVEPDGLRAPQRRVEQFRKAHETAA